MFGAIIITVVITGLGLLVVLLRNHSKEQLREIKNLRIEIDRLRRRIEDMETTDQKRREKNAYQRGFYNGRETDTLYREFVKTVETKHRATVMMSGKEKEGEYKHE